MSLPPIGYERPALSRGLPHPQGFVQERRHQKTALQSRSSQYSQTSRRFRLPSLTYTGTHFRLPWVHETMGSVIVASSLENSVNRIFTHICFVINFQSSSRFHSVFKILLQFTAIKTDNISGSQLRYKIGIFLHSV